MDARAGASDGRRRGVLARLRPADTPSEGKLEALLRTMRAAAPRADLKPIERAFAVAERYHRDQFRASGERFVEHPLEVAAILAELNMDTTTIVAALLHDTVEDTALTLEDLRAEFGEEVTHIIDGVTKLDKVTFDSREAAQAETIRKMIIAMAKDIRVLLIKLADRLHNMRTVGHLSRDTQEKKARETIDIYAPLAHRLGINQIKWQLEDLAFATLYPKQFDEIVRMVEERQPEREDILEQVMEELRLAMKNAKIKAQISGRPKNYWSIYQKMVAGGREFSDIYDLVGVRIMAPSVKDCYAALGIIHGLRKPIPGRVKDFIAMPKFNMYQSLHTTVVGPRGKPLEIQIRTEAMNRTAEYGIAAHWKYKDGKAKDDADLSWLRQMLEWQKEMKDPREFMESLRIDLYQDEVFVFTPKGDVMQFPRGATPLDFAYAIHTEVGHRCAGARVNGRLVPLSTPLDSGDTVDVITSKSPDAAPSKDWLAIVQTSRARSKIRHWFSRERREDAIERGRDELARAIKRTGMPVVQTMNGRIMEQAIAAMNLKSLEALIIALGENRVSISTVMQHLEHESGDDEVVQPRVIKPRRRPSNFGVVVDGDGDFLIRLAKCCTPVPPDGIRGFITRGRGISVHRNDCPNTASLDSEPERIVAVSWDPGLSGAFTVGIVLQALDRHKLLRDVSDAISEMGVNILSSSTTTDPRTREATFRFSVEVADPAHLDHILNQLRRVNGVYEASRVVPGRTSSH